jgi:hypothetical protein
MIKKNVYVAIFSLSCAGVSYGAEQGSVESEEIMTPKSPLSFYSDTSVSDSEGEEKEGAIKRPSRVRRTKEFFEKYSSNKKSPTPIKEDLESAYESDSGGSISDGDRGEERDPEKQKKTRALRALSLKLDKKVTALNNFAASREDAQKEFEKLARKFSEEAPVLGHGGSDPEIKALIESKVSKIRHPARVAWEVWDGKVD